MNLKYTYKGKSLRQYCYDSGINEKGYKTILARIKNKCMTIQEAFDFKNPSAREDQLQRKRENHRRYLGYSDEEIKMSKEEAHKYGIMKKAKYIVGDKTLKQYCKENGLSYQTIVSRILNNNMSVREAISEPIVHQRKFYWNGQPINKLFDKNTTKRIYGRVSEGWSLEDACTIPVDSFHNRKPVEDSVKSIFWRTLGYRKSGVRIINNKQKGVSL